MSATRSPFLDIVRPLVRMVEEGLESPDRPIHFTITGDAGVLPANVTTPLAVVLTELLQNVVEHGYPAGERAARARAASQLQLAKVADVVTIRVIDDGVGVAREFRVGRRGWSRVHDRAHVRRARPRWRRS